MKSYFDGMKEYEFLIRREYYLLNTRYVKEIIWYRIAGLYYLEISW